MKTIRTILATFGFTSALYGAFALLSMRLKPAFTGRSIYQLFRDTGFVALVIGIGCVLSFVIMTVAIVSFRDDGDRRKREYYDDDETDDEFLEEETVPEERAEEADESWSPEIKRKQRRALRHADEEPTPDLFADEDDEEEPISIRGNDDEAFARPAADTDFVPEPENAEAQQPSTEEGEPLKGEPAPGKQCIYCGNTIDADSAFCIYCGKRV